MKKLFLITTFLFFLTKVSYGQEIEMKMNLMGYKFTQSGVKLSWKDLLNETKQYPKSHELIKKAKSQNTISTILALGGGALIGIPIGASVSDDKPNWTLAYIGGGIALIGIPLTISSAKNTKEGIEMYNSNYKSTSSHFEPKYNIIANHQGIGISMNF